MQNSKIKLEKLADIIKRNDPAGLIAGGAPDDEYASETNEIYRLLIKNKDASNLHKKIKDIFVESFGEDTLLDSTSLLTISKELEILLCE